jgi:hypothetical protein
MLSNAIMLTWLRSHVATTRGGRRPTIAAPEIRSLKRVRSGRRVGVKAASSSSYSHRCTGAQEGARREAGEPNKPGGGAGRRRQTWAPTVRFYPLAHRTEVRGCRVLLVSALSVHILPRAAANSSRETIFITSSMKATSWPSGKIRRYSSSVAEKMSYTQFSAPSITWIFFIPST